MFGFGKRPAPAPATQPPSPRPVAAANGHASGHVAPRPPKAAAPDPAPEHPRVAAAQFWLVPDNGRLAVERMDPERRTAGGLYLPDEAVEKSCRVEVIAVCPEWVEDGVRRESRYRPGDYLIVSKYAGEEVVLDRGVMKLVLVREADVLARIGIRPTADHIPDVKSVPSERPGVLLEVEGGGPEEYANIPG